jgi:homoserine dehydrogenase
MASIALIGRGKISSESKEQLEESGHDVHVEVDSKYAYQNGKIVAPQREYRHFMGGVDAAMLMIGNGKGSVNRDYMHSLLELNIPVVTSEKQALSNYFEEFKDELDRIGYNAACGGGTGMLSSGRMHMNGKNSSIHAVVNGTLNFIFYGLSQGRSLRSLVAEAKRRGLTEPGAEAILDIINAEAYSDVPMKVAILFNILNLGVMNARDIKTRKLDERGLKRILSEAQNRRFAVSITREKPEQDCLGGFSYSKNGWHIKAGFYDVREHPLLRKILPIEEENSLMIEDRRNGTCWSITGAGAGPKPTVSVMMSDLERLLKDETRKAA